MCDPVRFVVSPNGLLMVTRGSLRPPCRLPTPLLAYQDPVTGATRLNTVQADSWAFSPRCHVTNHEIEMGKEEMVELSVAPTL